MGARTKIEGTRRLVKAWAKIRAAGFSKDEAVRIVKDALRASYTEFIIHDYLLPHHGSMEITPSVARCVTYKSLGLRMWFMRGFANTNVSCYTTLKARCIETWFRVIALESTAPLPLHKTLRNFAAKGRRACWGAFKVPFGLGVSEAVATINAIRKNIDLGVSDHRDVDGIEVGGAGTLGIEYDVNWYDVRINGVKIRLYRVDGGYRLETPEHTWRGDFEIYCIQP